MGERRNNMTDYHWQDTYRRACQLFKTRPNAEQEQAVLEAFQEGPRFVIEETERIGAAVESGHVRSGWAVLYKVVTSQVADITVSDVGERTKRIKKAELWIEYAGCYFDRETELLDEVFGSRGLLRQWAKDDTLRERILAKYRELRPNAENLERESEAWQRDLGNRRAEIQAALRSSRRAAAPHGLDRIDDGPCTDCAHVGERYRYGQMRVCTNCATTRINVAKHLARDHVHELERGLPLQEALTPEEAKA
jgi:hypothetical protein